MFLKFGTYKKYMYLCNVKQVCWACSNGHNKGT